jgi:hypothetical protein
VIATVMVAVAVVLVVGARTAIDAWQDDAVRSAPTADPTPIELAIGDERLAIPANMIRSSKVRRGGKVERIDLAVHWPSMSGYTDELADAFRDGAPSAPIVYATLSLRDGPVDSTGRLDTVYARFFEGTAVAGPSGLVGRQLSRESGYSGEIVFFDPGSRTPFVARCPVEALPDMPATCLRDINVGRNLSLLYRFDRGLMGDWRDLDEAMRSLASGILAP